MRKKIIKILSLISILCLSCFLLTACYSSITTPPPEEEHVCDFDDGKCVCGEWFTIGLKYQLSEDGSYYILKDKGTCTDKIIKIPVLHEGKPVKELAIGALDSDGQFSFIEIIIPEGVTSIGASAFANNYSLRSVTLPSTLVELGVSAFSGCKNLQSITIPDNVTTIGSNTFNNCERLENIVFGDNIKNIGLYAFEGVPENLFKVENGVKYLGNSSSDYYALVSVEDKSITSLTISSDCKIMADSSVYDCLELLSAVVPDNVTDIGNYAFFNCTKLQEVSLSNNVESIGIGVFNNCKELVSIKLGSKIKTIEKDVFISCEKLTDVYFNGTLEDWAQIDFKNAASNPVAANIPVNFYINNEVLTEINISTATEISAYAFAYFFNVKKVTIGASVSSIGCMAFYGCINLDEVVFEDTDKWFYFYPNVERIEIDVTNVNNMVRMLNAQNNITFVKE